MSLGSQPGERRGGRVKGTPNRASLERAAIQTRAAEMLADVAGGRTFTPHEHAMAAYMEAACEADRKPWSGDAHTLLVETYSDTRLPRAMRIDAAKSAIRFERPALAATTLAGDADNPITLRTIDARTPLDGRMTALLLAAQVPVTTHDVDDSGETTHTITE